MYVCVILLLVLCKKRIRIIYSRTTPLPRYLREIKKLATHFWVLSVHIYVSSWYVVKLNVNVNVKNSSQVFTLFT